MTIFTAKREGNKLITISVEEVGPSIPFNPAPFIDLIVDKMIADLKSGKAQVEAE